jgi:hypothetical protein
MSAVASHNFVIPAGTSWSQLINWKTGDPPTEVATTGFSARMQLRASHSSAAVVVELTTGNNRIALSNSGNITLSLSPSVTSSIPAGKYVYDLELVSGAGQVTRLLEGAATVTPEVTR